MRWECKVFDFTRIFVFMFIHLIAQFKFHTPSIMTSKLFSTQPAPCVPKRRYDIARVVSKAHSDQCDSNVVVQSTGRRFILESVAAISALSLIPAKAVFADDFKVSESGLKYLDLKEGSGQEPKPGSRCVVHWAGYTEGYQGKRFGNSSLKDEPYEFVLGKHTAIPAFEEAVAGMKVGGIRRIQILGIHPELGYPRDRSERFVSSESNIFKYRFGPQPNDLGGQRALDFVLDNPTLQPFNRDLLIDIKLLSVR